MIQESWDDFFGFFMDFRTVWFYNRITTALASLDSITGQSKRDEREIKVDQSQRRHFLGFH